MLSLNLKSGDYLTIGNNIAVQIFEQSGSSFRVAVKAPREIPILRGEVHERTGVRPDGLRNKRPKSPSERRYDAKHFEEWAEKKENREKEQKREAEEKAAVVRELIDIVEHMDELIAAHGQTGIQSKLSDLRSRLANIEAVQSGNDQGGCSEHEHTEN